MVITGVVLAQDLNVEIETDFDLDISLQAELNTMVDGKVVFDIDSNRKLKMVSKSNNFFPIAVKANRIDFDKGAFSKLKLVTDKINDIF
ncbi:hypothetical protein [Leadbetterella byssophila]|uniref:hypothetical protein n=1 Tax=Leadbetterella byssophila TaxID=316068 RepID=UPI0005A0E6C5|nr:hypothetical protein [Leadbetterella byssophila]